MNLIEEMLFLQCPSGVPIKDLGDVCYISWGNTNITKSSYIKNSDGYIAYSATGPDGVLDFFDHDRDAVVLSAIGARCGRTWFATGKWTSIKNTIFFYSLDTDVLLDKFVYWYTSQESYWPRSTSAQPFISLGDSKKLKIPVPPLEVQHKIIELLDTYANLETTLAAEIDNEITARKRQYAHYREELFESDSANSKTIDEVAKIWRGRRFVKDDIKSEGVPAIHYGEIYTKYGLAAKEAYSFLDPTLASKLRFVSPGDVVLVSAGETIEDIGKSFAWLGDQDVVIHDACYGLRSKLVDPRYMVHFFNTHSFRSQLRRYISSSKISAISTEKLGKVFIPVPDLERQRAVANILDELDQKIVSLLEELSSEKKARREQYMHYKQRVLTFPEMVTS